MADPVRGSSYGSPGLSGAIKDAVTAVARTVAPRSVTQIKPRNDDAEAVGTGSDDPTGRMKAAQSSDRDNSYNY